MRTIVLAAFAITTFLAAVTIDRTDAQCRGLWQGSISRWMRWTTWRSGCSSPLSRLSLGLGEWLKGSALLLGCSHLQRFSSALRVLCTAG
jgi:hypothetical protein